MRIALFSWMFVASAVVSLGCESGKTGGNGAPNPGSSPSGVAPQNQLGRLAKGDEPCRSCTVDSKCAWSASGDSSLPCCSYTGEPTAGQWHASGSTARCLAQMAGAPISPAKGVGKLLPLAKPGEACTRCSFTNRCFLSLDSADAPCCDYAGGRTPAEWPDAPDTARCLGEIVQRNPNGG